MASGNSLRPWQLTKGKTGKPPRPPSPGLFLGRIGEIWDVVGWRLGKATGGRIDLPTSDEIELASDRFFKRGIFTPVGEPSPAKRQK